MTMVRTAAVVATLAFAGAASSAPQGQEVTGPVAVYWMSASTSTGMGGMMGGGGAGGARPNYAAMMMGGGFNPNAVSRTLTLQLGSRERPQGAPTAEHDPPAGLGVGPALPLVTPQPTEPVAAPPAGPPGPPPQFHQPHGRMLIFWGCGEHAGPGQPLIIDFANLGSAAGAERMAGLVRGLAVNRMQPPTAATSATYGEWPNAQSSVAVPPQGSLTGPHLVRGDYSPDIRFELTPAQDFLPPFQLIQNQINPTGSAGLAWAPMAGARGFFAAMFGANRDQVVMWTSSAVQAPAFGMADYLSNGEIDRLVGQGVLMSASQTQCVIPEEAAQAAGRAGFFTLNAYGGEANFDYPPRPRAPEPWRIAWQVKVRYRSATSGMVGMNMGAMMGGTGQQAPGQPQDQPPPPPPQQPGIGSMIRNGLGGFIP
jgi:hypothetical protein